MNRLRDLIVRGKLAPGTHIAESSICDLLNVSRTPLREALKLLANEGLVELRPNRGAIVALMRAEQIRALFEVIGGVERLGAELAASRLTSSELKKLESMQLKMEAHFKSSERDRYFLLNQKIHRFIVAGSKNEVLVQTHASLLARAERARYLALDSDARWAQSIDEHRAILEALKSRDAGAAGALLGKHVKHTGEALTTALDCSS